MYVKYFHWNFTHTHAHKFELHEPQKWKGYYKYLFGRIIVDHSLPLTQQFY